MSMFTHRHVQFLKRHGVANAEEITALANQAQELLNQRRFEEARALIDTIDEPITRETLENCYRFDSTSWCFRPE